jgi:dTDP-glucose 4,6-dehydratase/UDP-glucuronate decarboxylase
VTASHALIERDLVEVAGALGDAADRLAGKVVLLTGAGGILPAYLADTVAWLNRHRLARPCRLLALVRSPVTAGSRLGHLLGRPDVTFLVQDVNGPIDPPARPDFIIHAASRASPRSYLADPLDTMDANTTATRRLLDLARAAGSEGFLYFSSGEIYGDVPAADVPTPETYTGGHDCTSPRACYTESKKYGETLCATYWRQYRVPVRTVRPFHVFGPGMRLDDGRVVADFLRDRVEGRPIRVLGGGRALRAFGYISDAAAGFWGALLAPGQDGEAFNIGDDRRMVSIAELARIVAELEEPRLPVEVEGAETPDHLKGSPSIVRPDLTKARSRLGYEPRVGLEEALRRTLAWHRAQRGMDTT